MINRPLFIPTALSIALMSPVQAQESLALEEIIVTSQKRVASLQDTPISVVAFGQDELEAIGAFEAGQVAEYAANVSIDRQPSSLDNYGYSIRGVGTGETSLLVENTVGVYIDGVYIARNTGAVFDVVDLERIEVLRGPQGTLYGRNTIGGAVNIITAKPSEEFGFKQHLTFGNRDFLRSKTTLDTGLLGDMFSAKLTYNFNEKDGLVNNSVHGNKLGAQESDAYRIALRLTPSDSFTADYTYDNSKRQSNGAMSQIVATRAPNNQLGGAITQAATAFASADRLDSLPMANAPGKDTNSDIEMHTITLEWEATDNLTIKYVGSMREWDSSTTGTDFGSFASDGATVLQDPTVAPGQFVPAGELRSVFLAERISDNEQMTHEFQFLGNLLDGKLQYTAGLYYFEEESNEANPQSFILPAIFAFGTQPAGAQAFLCGDFVSPAPCFGKDVQLSTPLFEYGSENDSIAAYGQFTYAFSDALDLTVGLRYTEDDKSAYLRNSRITNPDGSIRENAAEDDWSNVSGGLTLNYAWNDDVRTYFTVANGYRAGGFGARSASREDFQLGFDEETVTNYEVGIKSDWADSRVRLNGAIFFMDYQDAQVNSFKAGEGGASSVTLNAGELEIKGLELELTAQVTEGLRLMLNYGYTDAKYTEFITQRTDPLTALPSPGPTADPVTGNEDISSFAVVGRTPKNNGAFIASYDAPAFSWGQLNLRAEVTYRDKMVFHPQLNAFDSTDDQTLVHARATLSEMSVLGGDLSVGLWGRNLTDEEYREWGIDFGTLGFAIDSFKEKRSYGVDLIYRFGG
ncbi:MAG: TonB-dependent receptor [Pseudomonadales bacterium]